MNFYGNAQMNWGTNRNSHWVAYVRHHEVPEFEALGWEDLKCLQGTHHGDFSTVMIWYQNDDPPMPESRKLKNGS